MFYALIGDCLCCLVYCGVDVWVVELFEVD